MKKSMTSMLALGLTLGTLASCSKLDDTAKNAEKATINSGRAADSSTRAAKAAEESREEIANARLMQRSGSASESRKEYLDEMMQMETLPMKVTNASKYVKAFEFQLWTGQKYDNKRYLDLLYEDAMEEFFRSLYELNGDKSLAKSNLSAFKLMGKGKEQSLDIYALSLAMHGIHNVQDSIVNDKKILSKTTSIYDLIKNGLRAAQDVENGKLALGELKEYEKTVYDYRADALALVQVRYNAMLTLAVARLSNIKDSKMKALSNIYLGLPRSYKSRFQDLSLGQQHQTNVYLDAAIKVKRFMQEIDMKPELIKPLRKLYEKMILEEKTILIQGEVSELALMKKKEHDEFRDNLSKMFIIEDNRLKIPNE